MTLKRKDIEDTPMIDLRTFIRSRFPGIYFEGGTPCYRQKPVRIILNEFPIQDSVMEGRMLGILNLRDIEQIDFNRDQAAGLAWIPDDRCLLYSDYFEKRYTDLRGFT